MIYLPRLRALARYKKKTSGIFVPRLHTDEISYVNNSRSLFKKYAQLVTRFSNTQEGRNFLDIPQYKESISFLTPNGWHLQTGESKSGEREIEFTFYSRAL